MVVNIETNKTLPFVVQKHYESRVFHWDLMLHRPGVEGADPDDRVLATWQLEIEPMAENLNEPITAKALADHRWAYLEYEGPISKNRGRCEIVDHGQYELIEWSENFWRVRLMGQRLVGTFELKKNIAGNGWTLSKCDRGE